MARSSNRAAIIRAAIDLAKSQGITGVTVDAVASAAGMTKGGVQYHFASKDDLMSAVVADIVQRTEDAAQRHLAAPFDQATPAERIAAYIRATVGAEAGAGELVIFLDESHGAGSGSAWADFQRRWTASRGFVPTIGQRIAILAADGLWMNDVTGFLSVSRAERTALIDQLIESAG